MSAEEPEAFRTFALDSPLTARTVRAKLVALRADYAKQVAEGYAKDWADYCRRIGVIEGLGIAVGVSEEVEQQERQ